MYDKYLDIFTSSPLFKNVARDNTEVVLGCFKPEKKIYHKNNPILCTGDAYKGIGMVLEGSLIMYKDTSEGDRITIKEFEPGNYFGELIAFSDQKNWPYSICAKTDSIVIFFSPDKIGGPCVNRCSHHSTLIRNMLRILNDSYIETDKRLSYLKIKRASAKIALYILNASKDSENPSKISLDMNRLELAVYLGLTRPTLSRELCSLRDLGAIAFDKNNITIIDLDKLEEKVRS
jgi:CRP-like cAMP-binding protein